MSSSAVSYGGPSRQKSSAGCGLAAIWGFATIWYGVLAAIWMAINRGRPSETGPRIFVGVFAAAGLLLLVAAISATISAFRFRGTELELQTNPGILGGKISGTFRVRQGVLKLGPLKARIASFRRYRGRNSSRDVMLWEGSEPVGQPFVSGGDLVTLPFSIRLPYDAEPTAYDFIWTLDLRSAKKGNVSFTVPVARTAQSSESQTMKALRPTVNTAPADAAVTIDRTLSGIDLDVPPPSWAWKWFVFIVVATAVGVIGSNLIFTRMQAPQDFFLIAYGGIAAVALFLGGLSVLSLAMYVRRVHADRTGVEIQYAFSGRKPKRLTRTDLADVNATYSNSSMKYSVDFVRADGKPMFGNLLQVKTKDEADWIATELRRAIFGAAQSEH